MSAAGVPRGPQRPPPEVTGSVFSSSRRPSRPRATRLPPAVEDGAGLCPELGIGLRRLVAWRARHDRLAVEAHELDDARVRDRDAGHSGQLVRERLDQLAVELLAAV